MTADSSRIPSKWSRRFVLWGSVLACTVMLVFVVGPFVTCKTAEIRVCALTGSTWTTTTWFGHFQSEQYKRTGMERWLRAHDSNFRPQWQHLSTNKWMLLGRSWACASAPASYQLRHIKDASVQLFTEEELRELVDTLKTGSKEEQRAAINGVLQEYFERASKS